MGNTYSHNTDITTIKPIDLFNLPKDYNWNDLKNSYKKLAVKSHPDKGGNKDVFDYITKCFQELASDLKMKESNKSHSELKHNFKNDVFTQLRPRFETDMDESFANKFNKMFDENKFVDEDIEYGYGEKMEKSTKNREDIDIRNIFRSEKVSSTKFNKAFEKKVPIKKDIIKYQEPEALHITKTIHFSELGNKTDDYTGVSENKQLNYTDYMKAHSEERIPTDYKRKEFRNTKEYQSYSNKYIQESFTSEEIKNQQKAKKHEEKMENKRLFRVKDRDEKIEKYYDKVSRLFIK